MEGPPELRTERLLLRPFRSDDVDDVLAYATDSEWNRYLGLPEPYTRRSAEEFVATAILSDREMHPMWAIEHEGYVAGGINLNVHGLTRAEMGYSLARPLWGRGLTTEAAQSVIAYGFGALGLARVHACADIRNRASWRVMEKLGMQREGVLRSNRLVRGVRVDDVLYAVLSGEWSPPSR